MQKIGVKFVILSGAHGVNRSHLGNAHMIPTIENYIIPQNGLFPNNEKLPLLHYKQGFNIKPITPNHIEKIFKENNWHNAWRDGIYTYHHYHSNTHEVLAIYAGHCQVELGGPNGKILLLETGDAIIIPVGVAHKNVTASNDFKCIGAYPFKIEYNLNYGKAHEHPHVDNDIASARLPETDPIFGNQGPLFRYWRQ